MAVTKEELHLRSLYVHHRTMEVLVKQVRLRRSAEQKAANFKRLLNLKEKELEVVQKKLEHNLQLQMLEEVMAVGKCCVWF